MKHLVFKVHFVKVKKFSYSPLALLQSSPLFSITTPLLNHISIPKPSLPLLLLICVRPKWPLMPLNPYQEPPPQPNPTPPPPPPNPPLHSPTNQTPPSAPSLSYILSSSIATTSISTPTSLTRLRDSLPENAHIYNFNEIRNATNNFLSKRHSSTSSSQSWRVKLTQKDAIIFQRKSRKPIEANELKSKLVLLCRSHQKEIIKLLGASISSNYIYLVYEYSNGSNLSNCLRNPKNFNFTVLSTWMSRIQIATDVAHGLEYIHYHTGFSESLVHKHVKSSGIIVTEPDFHAKICHFGAAELCGETAEHGGEGRRKMQFEGVRGYMSPEFQETGEATQESDVYAFGVVLLELLCGEEPLRYKMDKASGNYRKISIVESAKMALVGGGGGGGDDGDVGREGRLRRWADRRINDSFPVEVFEKLTRVALECVHVEAGNRPNMKRVSGKISKLYLESKIWSGRINVPNDISVSLAPR